VQYGAFVQQSLPLVQFVPATPHGFVPHTPELHVNGEAQSSSSTQRCPLAPGVR
jgi:hypothetical protein